MIAPTITDFLLFGEKKCCSCGAKLPKGSDFFPPDGTNDSGLKPTCRECKNRQSRESYRRDRVEILAKQKIHRGRKAVSA